jgi:hypothetical protein
MFNVRIPLYTICLIMCKEYNPCSPNAPFKVNVSDLLIASNFQPCCFTNSVCGESRSRKHTVLLIEAKRRLVIGACLKPVVRATAGQANIIWHTTDMH